MKRDLANISLQARPWAEDCLVPLPCMLSSPGHADLRRSASLPTGDTVGIILSAVSDYGFGNQLLSTLPILGTAHLGVAELTRLAQGKTFLVVLVSFVGAGFAFLSTNAA